MDTPPAMETARGCAPPIPPKPAVKVSLPAKEYTSQCFLAAATNVSYVPCKIPWVPI